ncbi:MAG: transposase [Candidatus Tectomicrobia bacterium]|nr:transposase [Candidatus Tectomicrobia bacterium]
MPLDGVVSKVRGAVGVQRKVVFPACASQADKCALGISAEGRRELLALRVAEAGSEAAWMALLNDLCSRGLRGRALRLIVTDGCPGLKATLERVNSFAASQRAGSMPCRTSSPRSAGAIRRRS